MCVSSLAEAVAPHDSCRPHAAQARLESSSQQGESKFWLVALIQDCRVLTAQETASAKCWLKIHWQDGAFPDKIRDEKRKLPNTDNFAEQSKDLDLEKLAVDLETGGLVYGMVDVAPDSFPINIDAIFLNQISAERISSLCWTKYDKGIVSVSGCEWNPNPVDRYSRTFPYVLCFLIPRTQVQIVVNVTVHAPMSLKRYPYDRHIVPFCLATRVTIDAQGQETKWKLSKKCPDWAPNKYHEDGTILSESQTTPDLEYNHKRCFAYLPKKKGQKPILCVLIERQPLNFMKRVALPAFIVVSIALSISGIQDSSFQEEYGAALTSLLTLTVFSYSVQSSLPTLTYLTWADIYFLV